MKTTVKKAGVIKKFWGVLGPGLITGASDDDPSGIATYTQAGAALLALKTYLWPGNIRELRNVIERAVILCKTGLVSEEHLPANIFIKTQPVRLGDPLSLDVIEETHIRRILASSKSLQEAADLLGIDQATLWRKRKQFKI